MDTIFIIITLMHHCGHTVLYCKKVTQAKQGPYICNYIHRGSKRRQLAEHIPQKAIHGGQSSGGIFPFSPPRKIGISSIESSAEHSN